MGTLYLVATPIGNLEDITLRALRVLREVDLIAAEDTRHTGRLLKHFEIETRMTSYHEHSDTRKRDEILRALETGDVALVSDAGTPLISDPGEELVNVAIERGIPVVPIPGASAVLTALTASGLPADEFTYLGFLPRSNTERRELLQTVATEPRTLVFFETPHRLRAALHDMLETFGGDRLITVARELTKLHEEFWRGTIESAIQHFETVEPRGEFTLVVDGAPAEEAGPWSDEQIKDALSKLAEEGVTGSRAVKQVARLADRKRSDVYDLSLEMKE